MELLIGLAILVAFDVAAWFWGADSLMPASTGADGRAVRWSL